MLTMKPTTHEWASWWAVRAISWFMAQCGGRIRGSRCDEILGRLSTSESWEEKDYEKALTRALGKGPPTTDRSSIPLFANLEDLAERIGLDEVQLEVIAFRTLYRLDKALREALDLSCRHELMTTEVLIDLVATVLDRPPDVIRLAIAPGGALLESGLFGVTDRCEEFGKKTTLMQGLANALLGARRPVDEMLSFCLTKASLGELANDDFRHLARERDLLRGLVGAAAKSHRQGVNVLLHGPPGTGKTQLAKLIAAQCGLELFEILGSNGEISFQGVERLDTLKLTMALCRDRTDAVILFDEAEDVWAKGNGSRGDDQKSSAKAVINRLIETAPVPVIWISNSVWQIDTAFLRRFDAIVEVVSPPLRSKALILERALPNLPAAGGWREGVVADPAVTPGVIARYAQAVRIAGLGDQEEGALCFEGLVRNWTIAATNQTPRPITKRGGDFDPALANASVDLELLGKCLADRRAGTVLLHGPPGSGKTEFAHYLGRAADMRVMSRRASDIISPYLGMTERNLARMFLEAQREDAVLLLDESDSFLRDRRKGERSWEVSEVNELLTQMEEFGGLFLCSTNLIETMDRAAMRRFAFKVEFRPMTAEQRRQALVRLMGELRWDSSAGIEPRVAIRLSQLEGLTAGDFAAVRRRTEIMKTVPDPQAVVTQLEEELGFHERCTTPMGFLAKLS